MNEDSGAENIDDSVPNQMYVRNMWEGEEGV